jgi:hypothetical protein
MLLFDWFYPTSNHPLQPSCNPLPATQRNRKGKRVKEWQLATKPSKKKKKKESKREEDYYNCGSLQLGGGRCVTNPNASKKRVVVFHYSSSMVGQVGSCDLNPGSQHLSLLSPRYSCNFYERKLYY